MEQLQIKISLEKADKFCVQPQYQSSEWQGGNNESSSDNKHDYLFDLYSSVLYLNVDFVVPYLLFLPQVLHHANHEARDEQHARSGLPSPSTSIRETFKRLPVLTYPRYCFSDFLSYSKRSKGGCQIREQLLHSISACMRSFQGVYKIRSPIKAENRQTSSRFVPWKSRGAPST